MKYIVFSNAINAWTLKKGLKKLNIELDVYHEQKKNNVVKHSISKVPLNSTLFFTEENSLKKYVKSNSYQFHPRFFSEELLDDKYNFAEFLCGIGEKPIPYSDIASVLDYPFFLKAKHSWKNNIKLPRGFICENEHKLNSSLNRLKKENLNENWFFKQKLLTSPLENNISTSGFFDHKNNKRNIMIVTKKTLGNEEKIATGVVVETIRDPNGLIPRTIKLLNALEYTGPFELEFFYEESDNEYYILELNPRFWMQHGIFVDYYDNAIIRRYLSIDQPKDWVENGIPLFKKIVWIDNIHYMRCYLNLKLDSLKKFRQLEGAKVFYPSRVRTLKFYFNLLLKKIF
ncbi:hypothetical protein NSQ77_14720 [Oceanobacillus sp. FSL K6-2867]|uniref:hypothetical protein n=1 Tax=Oceanobacillus sp. FSL K6-2867 TaxID=2954748 RepID=UPI0030D96FD5